MPEAHAKLSASGSAKWLGCPAALALEALINEPDTGNVYSYEGTAAHGVLERSLRRNVEPASFLGSRVLIDTKVELVVTQEMVNNVEIAIEYINRLSARNAFYEEKVDYSHLAPGGFGTADVVLEVYEKLAAAKRVNTLYVIDFKYGAGIKVDAFENSQGMLYGLGALNTLDPLFDQDIERVIIVIIQPRMDNISEYEISVADLNKWGEEIKPKAQKAHDLYESVDYETYNETSGATGAEAIFYPENFKPSKKTCQWCQGRRLKRCKAHAQSGYSAAVEGFDDLTAEKKADLPAVEVSADTLKDPAFLDNADLAAIWLNISLFKSFTEDLGEEIAARINGGQDVPGLRLVPTEKKRAWRLDEAETLRAIRTSGLQKKDYETIGIVSPTEAEKLLKEVKPKDHARRYKRLEAAAVHRPKGKDKIIEDKRKTLEDEDDLLG